MLDLARERPAAVVFLDREVVERDRPRAECLADQRELADRDALVGGGRDVHAFVDRPIRRAGRSGRCIERREVEPLLGDAPDLGGIWVHPTIR